MIKRRAFKYRIVRPDKHREKFQQFAGAARWIYNRGLEQRTKAYKEQGKTLTYYEQNDELVSLKEEFPWLKEVHSQVPQQSLKNLDFAFKNLYRNIKQGKPPGYPKFKKRGVRDSFRFPQGVRVEGSQAYLPKIGWVKFRKSREIQGIIKETTIIQEGNAWYISFSCEIEIPDPVPALLNEDRAIGIDVGLKVFATTSAGKENTLDQIENPRYLKKNLSKIKHLSKKLSKKTSKSKNRLKARLKLSKHHAKVKNKRTDFAQKLSTKMIKNHDIFCIESLDISNLLTKSSRGLSRAISDAGWRGFLHCLKYKAEECGKHIVEAGKYFPSSQLCHICGHQKEMPLELREYECPNCGLKIDRDYNSAIVLKAAGMSVLKPVELPRIRGALKQESLAFRRERFKLISTICTPRSN
jgi:putative transposase